MTTSEATADPVAGLNPDLGPESVGKIVQQSADVRVEGPRGRDGGCSALFLLLHLAHQALRLPHREATAGDLGRGGTLPRSLNAEQGASVPHFQLTSFQGALDVVVEFQKAEQIGDAGP